MCLNEIIFFKSQLFAVNIEIGDKYCAFCLAFIRLQVIKMISETNFNCENFTYLIISTLKTILYGINVSGI